MLRSLVASVHLAELPDQDKARVMAQRHPGVAPLQGPALVSLRLAQLLASPGARSPGDSSSSGSAPALCCGGLTALRWMPDWPLQSGHRLSPWALAASLSAPACALLPCSLTPMNFLLKMPVLEHVLLWRRQSSSLQAAEALLAELGFTRSQARKGRPLGMADLMKWAARMEVPLCRASAAVVVPVQHRWWCTLRGP